MLPLGDEIRAQCPRLAACCVTLELSHLLQQLPEQRCLTCCQVLREVVDDSLAVGLAAACLQEAHDALSQLCSLINLR